MDVFVAEIVSVGPFLKCQSFLAASPPKIYTKTTFKDEPRRWFTLPSSHTQAQPQMVMHKAIEDCVQKREDLRKVVSSSESGDTLWSEDTDKVPQESASLLDHLRELTRAEHAVYLRDLKRQRARILQLEQTQNDTNILTEKEQKLLQSKGQIWSEIDWFQTLP